MPPRPDIILTSFDEEKFWSRVDKSGGPDACWLWTAGTFRGGYGAFKIAGKTLKAHRVSWVLAHGQIPYRAKYPGICVCHNCPQGDQPRCVNPAHLFLGEQLHNIRDMMKKGRAKFLKGEAHYTHTHPELRSYGDKHWSRLHPEKVKRGEHSGNAKLNADQVVEIRSLYASGKASYTLLGIFFGVSEASIRRVIKRELWKHVP